MSTTLDETRKEKLAAATRTQQRCEAAFRAASDALRQFDAAHKVLDPTSSKERQSLINAKAQAASALREAKDCFDFAHHEHYAMLRDWGHSSGKYWRGDKRYEDRG
jgi:ElaB/YqjD/DUF883 family membrane-anchored ribosome-binding protein